MEVIFRQLLLIPASTLPARCYVGIAALLSSSSSFISWYIIKPAIPFCQGNGRQIFKTRLWSVSNLTRNCTQGKSKQALRIPLMTKATTILCQIINLFYQFFLYKFIMHAIQIQSCQFFWIYHQIFSPLLTSIIKITSRNPNINIWNPFGWGIF